MARVSRARFPRHAMAHHQDIPGHAVVLRLRVFPAWHDPAGDCRKNALPRTTLRETHLWLLRHECGRCVDFMARLEPGSVEICVSSRLQCVPRVLGGPPRLTRWVACCELSPGILALLAATH